MPMCGSAAARATSKAILTTPKSPFSMGTQTALRSPMRTPSCRVKMPQATTQAVKNNPAVRPLSWAYEEPQWLDGEQERDRDDHRGQRTERVGAQDQRPVAPPDCGMNG